MGVIIKVNRALLPKDGSTLLECEDATASSIESGRFAIADGATEGFDSKRWARYLTRVWLRPSTAAVDAYELPAGVARMGEQLTKRWSRRVLPWYLEEKSASGAFAAFLGLTVSPDGIWSAVAIGDCCLFHERGCVLERSFPIEDPSDFSSRPLLVGSKSSPTQMREALKQARGVCLPGDTLLLTSDALACWYLTYGLEDGSLRSELHNAATEIGHCKAFVQRERKLKRLRNDDVALLRLTVSIPAA